MPIAGWLRRLWPRTIRRQLILGICGLVAAVMAAFVYQTVERQREFLLDQSEERAIALTETLAANSVSWVLANDLVGLQEVVESIKRYPGLRFVLVVDRDGRVLAHNDPRQTGRYLRDSASLAALSGAKGGRRIAQTNDMIDAIAPIQARGVTIGWARTGISQKQLRRSIVEITQNGVYYAAVAIVLGALLALAVARSLTRGMNELVEATGKMAEGDYTVRAKAGREDEVGALSEAFNAMAAALGKSSRELCEREDALRRLIGSLPAAVIVYGPDARVRYSNEAACKILGLSETDIAGKVANDPVWRFIHEDGSPMSDADNPVNRVIEKLEPLSGSLMGGGAEARWIHVNAYPELDADGELRQVILSFMDITRRRQQEQALRQGEARLKEAQRVAHVGDWVWNASLRTLACSDELFRILEMDEEPDANKARASYKKLRQKLHPQDREAVLEAFANAIEHKKPYDITYRLLLKDGRIKHVNERCETIFDAAGKPLHSLGTVHDVTGRVTAEEEVRKLNQELEARVIKRTEALERANRELEGFTYSVSHDLRAPLRAIDGYSRMLLEDYGDHFDEEGGRRLKIVSQSAVRLGRIIDDLLAYAHMSRHEIVVETVDVEAMARRIFEAAREAAPERSISLRMGKLPPARGDRVMLNQVLANLIDNAVKFTRSKAEAVIEVGGSSDASANTYYIKDNGVGFDMRFKHKLFGVFQRLHPGEDFEGTGIGLAIVKGIVARQGGKVWAEGRLNDGATFYFTLPNIDKPLSGLS
jgi:PAS domain S-box-containing protein